MTLYVSPHLQHLGKLRDEGLDLRDAGTRRDVLRIGILNLMPLKPESEADFLRVLQPSGMDIEVSFLATESYVSKNTPAAYLAANYRGLSALLDTRLDGLIVTGAYLGVRFATFEAVVFWPEIQRILAWAEEKRTPRLGVCWGAQAMMYQTHGIPAVQLPRRLFDVFPQDVKLEGHALAAGLGRTIYAPVTRKTTTLDDDVARRADLDYIAGAADTGPCLLADRDLSRTYILNHLEYATTFLQQEYLWRLEHEADPPFPTSYFKTSDPRGEVIDRWKVTAHAVYSSWVRSVCAR